MEVLALLADAIEACMEAEEGDLQYLLEATVEDLRAIAAGDEPVAVAYLLANPVS